MPRYLISFDDGSMDHIPDEDFPAVGEAAHAVVRQAKAAGAWIFGGGILRQQATIVAADGTVSAGPVPETKAVVGGFSIIEVPSREEALAWAARIAESCRCAQEVREIMYDPEGSDGKKEWIEIYNEGPYLLDLSTVKFADKSAHVLNPPPKNGGASAGRQICWPTK